jgi:outer membrane protein assembly factor BamB
VHSASTAHYRRLALIGSLLAVLSLAACAGGPPAATSWPGVALSGDIAYIAFNQNVYAVNLATRTELWRWGSAIGDTYYGMPALAGDRVIVGGYSKGRAYALPANGGDAVWTFVSDPGNVIPGLDLLKNPNGAVVAGVGLAGDLAYVGLNNGHLSAVDVTNGSERWTFRTPDHNGFWSTPVVADGTVYATSLGHELYAFDAATGAQRGEPIDLGAPIGGDMTIARGLGLLGTFDNRVVAIDLNTRQMRWQHAVDGWVWGVPQVYGDQVYAATLQGTVYALNLSDGSEVWHRSFSTAETTVTIRAPLLVTADAIYVAARNGQLHALKREEGGPDLWNPVAISGAQLLSQPQLWHWENKDYVVIAPMGVDTLLHIRDAANGTEAWAFKPAS